MISSDVLCGSGLSSSTALEMAALRAFQAVPAFVPAVVDCYRAASGHEPEIYVCRASDGASRVG